MADLKNAVPSSLRKPSDTSRFAYDLISQAQRTTFAGVDVNVAPRAKSRFARLPEEPEDARITGVTRSLARRLLGLNMPKLMVSAKTIA